MMQAAEYGSLYNPVPDRQNVSVIVGRDLVRHGLRQTGAQRRMGPSAVIVDCPIPNSHLQMALVEGDQEVQTLATKAAAQSLAYGVRLRGSYRCPQNPYSQTGKTLVNRLREDAVPIMEDEAVGMAARERFPELLQCPFRRGMRRDVMVEDLAGSDLYDDEDVEGTECSGDHHEEVAGHHDLGVVADEGQPTLFRVRRAHGTVTAEVVADGAWGDLNGQLQVQLVGDPFLGPTRIITSNLADQPLEVLW